MSTNFVKSKVCRQFPALFGLYTSSKLSLPYFEFSLKLGLNQSYFLKRFYSNQNEDVKISEKDSSAIYDW